MLKEYALQPELLSSWEVVVRLYDKFGYGCGRVIARYPKRWTRMVWESLGECRPGDKLRIVERLKQFESALYPRQNEWDGQKTWLNNAIEEHTKRPFHAIISRDNPSSVSAVICEADLYSKEVEPRWKAERQLRIERTAIAMAACAEPLLRNSKEILFVDPHFRPNAPRFTRPLKAFLQTIVARPPDIPVRRIEIHTGHTTAGSKTFFDGECRRSLPPLIPRGLTVRFIRWDQGHLHNRFILTEYGGMKFPNGLDDHDDSPLMHDIVDLLESEPYQATWQEYQQESSLFPRIEDDLIIEGTG